MRNVYDIMTLKLRKGVGDENGDKKDRSGWGRTDGERYC